MDDEEVGSEECNLAKQEAVVYIKAYLEEVSLAEAICVLRPEFPHCEETISTEREIEIPPKEGGADSEIDVNQMLCVLHPEFPNCE